MGIVGGLGFHFIYILWPAYGLAVVFFLIFCRLGHINPSGPFRFSNFEISLHFLKLIVVGGYFFTALVNLFTRRLIVTASINKNNRVQKSSTILRGSWILQPTRLIFRWCLVKSFF